MWPLKKKTKEGPVIIIKDCVSYCKDGYLPGQDQRCPRWVILDRTYNIEGKIEVKTLGRCAIAWLPDLLIETRHVLSELLKQKG